MITRITKANADQYRALFADAVGALKTHDTNGNLVGTPGAGDPVISIKETYQEVTVSEEEFAGGDYYIWEDASSKWVRTELDAVYNPDARYALRIESSESISTLEEYFSYIADLRAINKRFTILPLDEEYFLIDANTRTIEIPKEFKNSGIAVQGDEVAEIIYFKINRYFDMDDLAGKDIFIQWRAPADADGNRAEGVSVPWIIDIETAPGYVIFGWPLSSELTAHPGKMDFAVRFYTYDDNEGKLVYSLSTLTASADIKEGLNYDLEKMLIDGAGIVDANNLIINRLVNSTINDASIPDPEEPVLVDDIIEAFNYDSQESEDGKYTIYNVYLTNPNNGDEEDGYYRVQATTSDAGAISYTWIKKDTEGELALDTLKSGIEFIPVNDIETDRNKVYYKKDAEDVYSAFVFSDQYPDLEAAAAAGIQLYERMSQATMNYDGENVLGTYQIRITNRVGRKTARKYGNIALIQGPVKPVINKDLKDLVEGILSEEDNALELEVEATTDEHSFVQYLYQRSTTAADADDYETVHTSKSNKYTILGQDYAEGVDDGDGFYRVVIESKLNHTVETVTGKPLRVTHPASPVTIVVSDSNLPNGGYDINNPISITATPNKFEKRIDDVDTITYQWYRYNGSQDTLLKDLDDAANGLYVARSTDEKLAKATSNSVLIPNTALNENGYYFCEVTNTYNGTIAKKCSSFFNVVDTRIEV